MHNQFDPENRQWCGEWPIVTIPTPEPEPIPESTPESEITPEPGMVTRIERVAQEGLSIGEMLSEGLSPWTLASWGVALIATLARKFRKKN